MRAFLLVLFLTGCVSTSTEKTESVEEIDIITYHPSSKEYIEEVKGLIAERNRIQRALRSISKYQLGLPPAVREDIHCMDSTIGIIEIPKVGYLKLAGSIANQPEQMEALLIGYIKTVLVALNEANVKIINREEDIRACYDKFKPGG